MEIKDVINLVNAGYTRAEIEAMAKGLNNPQPDTQPNTQPNTQPAANDFAAQLAALTAAIQAHGILNSNQPRQETADDILANILDPGRNKEVTK